MFNYFLPHPQTHEKSHLLSWRFFLIYILLFVLLQSSFNLFSYYNPGVLGVNSQITVEEIIKDTNSERQKMGLKPVSENHSLDTAATLKAQNMFEENYWAHFSPSGKDPWGFISRSGYKFSYAGENLARNFTTSQDVVKAWMSSPSHRENILNSNYQEIGIAVVDGILLGQKTTLVVQMFGRAFEPLAAKPEIDVGGKKFEIASQEIKKDNPLVAVAGSSKQIEPSLINPYLTTKVLAITLMSFIGVLLAADMIALKRRGVFRLSSHHLAHMSFLGLSSACLLITPIGSIL